MWRWLTLVFCKHHWHTALPDAWECCWCGTKRDFETMPQDKTEDCNRTPDTTGW